MIWALNVGLFSNVVKLPGCRRIDNPKAHNLNKLFNGAFKMHKIYFLKSCKLCKGTPVVTGVNGKSRHFSTKKIHGINGR